MLWFLKKQVKSSISLKKLQKSFWGTCFETCDYGSRYEKGYYLKNSKDYENDENKETI